MNNGRVTQLVRVGNSKLLSRGFEPHHALKNNWNERQTL